MKWPFMCQCTSKKLLLIHILGNATHHVIMCSHHTNATLNNSAAKCSCSSIGATVFRSKLFQILQLTTANFTHIVTTGNFLWPLSPTKYAVFVAGNYN